MAKTRKIVRNRKNKNVRKIVKKKRSKKKNTRRTVKKVSVHEVGNTDSANIASFNGLITENQLDAWVQGNAESAQGIIPELIYRLVAASSPKPKDRRFPGGDSVGQPGPDGFLNTDIGFNPFVPEGKSFWEIGTGISAGDKATSDYKKLTASVPKNIRRESGFIFVTPLSGRRKWPYTWEKTAQAKWVEKRRKQNKWKSVEVVDGSRLIDWIHHFPVVEQWLAVKIGLPATEIQTLEQRWDDIKTIGSPPTLVPGVFLANREDACKKLQEVFSETISQLKLDTQFSDQATNFVAAYVAAMDDDNAKADLIARSLIVLSANAWNDIIRLREKHFLIADFDLDDPDSAGTILLNKALRAGHTVIFHGMPGGPPHPNRVLIKNPKSFQVKEALEKAGHNEERARVLAQQSNGNLSTLLRCLQNLSTIPEWAQGTEAAELAIAELLGSWNEHSEADKSIVEKLSKKSYGEWIEKIREIICHPNTPLIQRDGKWKFVARYEGLYALGTRLYDEHLDRLKEISLIVLGERDPQFELSPDERYAASIHSKILKHSNLIRKGLAESLAILGSHPLALNSCTLGKAEAIANQTVREILDSTDWVLWASLNDLLPLLAEAAPREFLDSVEKALKTDPCPFDMIFMQEGKGITGRNYMTGLLWALETLAWDPDYLMTVTSILGELASKDPGGKWANRPINSLATIFLPWLPQTCADIKKRRAAIENLIKEEAEVAWKLLISLLPGSHQSSFGSHKPEWRELIPDDWKKNVTNREYWEQSIVYAELAVNAAKQDIEKLNNLIEHIENLPPSAQDQLIDHLQSDSIISLPQIHRQELWTKLVDLVTRHKKFANAEWAMKPDLLTKITTIAESLVPNSPIYRYKRLFSDKTIDLFEERGNYEEQRRQLESKQQNALKEIFESEGIKGIFEFTEVVESSWRVGISFGLIAENNVDKNILPSLLEAEKKCLAQFAGGYILGRYSAQKWQWVDKLDTSQWPVSQKGQLLAYLPFIPDTWQRVTSILKEDESSYWSKTNANPYQANEGLEWAIDRLVQYNRPYDAIRCLGHLIHEKQPIDNQQAVRVLQSAINSPKDTSNMDVYDIVDIIKTLQENPGNSADDLMKIEFVFLPLLDRHHGAFPKILEHRLADDPAFFCDIIRILFKSRKKSRSTKKITKQENQIAMNAYPLLYNWRTPPGEQKDGTFNSEKFISWLNDVKASCEKSGHLGIALEMIGHVLVYSPSDPDGLWLHHTIATALNAKDADDMRNGFRLELFNSRGVHWIDPSGKQELEIAKGYRIKAEEIEHHGYHRLAKYLRQLVADYEREAKRIVTRDIFDD